MHPNGENKEAKGSKASVMDCPSKGAMAGCSPSSCGSMPKEHIKHGHPRVYKILEELAELHSKKNHDYAGGGPAMGNFDRRSELYSLYPGLDLTDPVVIALVDMLKQLDAVLWMKATHYDGTVEGIQSRLRDMALYSVLSMVLEEENSVFPMLKVPLLPFSPELGKKMTDARMALEKTLWNEDPPDNISNEDPAEVTPDHV